MSNFTVTYEIELEADTPIEAALMVENTLKNSIYRPCFSIIKDGEEPVMIDLDTPYFQNMR